MITPKGFLNCYERDELNQLSNQMEFISLRFTLDAECPVYDLMEDKIIDDYYTNNDGLHEVVFYNVDEELIESLGPDELAEFFGLEPEFVVAMEVN
jgi:hypothetical protein